jgi:hypothetical protein
MTWYRLTTTVTWGSPIHIFLKKNVSEKNGGTPSYHPKLLFSDGFIKSHPAKAEATAIPRPT